MPTALIFKAVGTALFLGLERAKLMAVGDLLKARSCKMDDTNPVLDKAAALLPAVPGVAAALDQLSGTRKAPEG